MIKKSLNLLVASAIVLAITVSTQSKFVTKYDRDVAYGAIRGGRIVGGEPALEGQFPYQVNIQLYGAHFCGGSLISPRHVLTSATCTSYGGVSNLSVRVGGLNKTSGEVIQVESIRQHPQYDEWTYDYNIAILKLSRPVTLSREVAIIDLTTVDPLGGLNVTVTGWGTTSESGNPINDVLRYVQLPIVDRETCQEDYPNNEVTESMICAGLAEGGKGDCYGDAGGPLVYIGDWPFPIYLQVGIVSWGFGCARPGVHSVYTSIANQREFIDANINDD